MANTLKLGAGKWATGTDTVLAFNDENNNFKPLPFSFSRASSATVVNQSGLIETVGSGEPRIDFLGNTKGALLLEPQRTNLITYSEDFSNAYWNKGGSSIISNTSISPDGGLNADKLFQDTSSGVHKIVKPYTGISGTNTCSIFVKPDGVTKIGISSTESVSVLSSFDLSNGTLISSLSDDYSITSFADGWFRISSTDIGGNRKMAVFLLDDTANYSYQGDGVSGLYIYGAQLEEGSYATSYIPTSGSAVTRIKDITTQSVPTTLTSTTGGTLFFEMTSLSNELQLITLSDGTDTNRVQLYYIPTNQFKIFLAVGNIGLVNTGVIITPTNNNKFAFKWSSSGTNLFINGVSVYSDTVSCVFPSGTLDQFNLMDALSTQYGLLGKIPDIRIFDTALTDAELQALTTI